MCRSKFNQIIGIEVQNEQEDMKGGAWRSPFSVFYREEFCLTKANTIKEEGVAQPPSEHQNHFFFQYQNKRSQKIIVPRCWFNDQNVIRDKTWESICKLWVGKSKEII